MSSAGTKENLVGKISKSRDVCTKRSAPVPSSTVTTVTGTADPTHVRFVMKTLQKVSNWRNTRRKFTISSKSADGAPDCRQKSEGTKHFSSS